MCLSTHDYILCAAKLAPLAPTICASATYVELYVLRCMYDKVYE